MTLSMDGLPIPTFSFPLSIDFILLVCFLQPRRTVQSARNQHQTGEWAASVDTKERDVAPW